jgi:anti-sigma B factor antagonist
VGRELERFPNGTELRTIRTSPATPRGLQGGFPVSVISSTRQVDGVTIVDLSGRITLGEGGVTLRNTVHGLLSKGLKRILLNLGEVNYIDSSGIGELVSSLTAAKKEGGELKLLNPTKRVLDLLQITKLHTLFDVKNDEAAAVQSFGK